MRGRLRAAALLAYASLLSALAPGCAPGSDLEAHGRGSGAGGTIGAGDSDSPAVAGDAGAGAMPGAPDGAAGSSLDERGPSGDLALDDPGPSEDDPEPGATDAGSPGAPDAGGVEPPRPPLFEPLPNDLIDSPVPGEISFVSDAAWEVDGVFEPTFEIRTPTANYWIVQPLGTMVSLEDRADRSEQWIAFSSGFRPQRGVPAFPERPASPITTTLDEDSQTPTHLRLLAESEDQAWKWIWDIYVTHVTLTLERAPGDTGLGYRGVPAGNLDSEDRLVFPDGSSQGARNSFGGDLAGPFEWVYLADTTLDRSLFLIQHADDELAERYQVRDNDSAHFLFGGGKLRELPLRFSLGLIDTHQHDAVTRRVELVHSAVAPR